MYALSRFIIVAWKWGSVRKALFAEPSIERLAQEDVQFVGHR